MTVRFPLLFAIAVALAPAVARADDVRTAIATDAAVALPVVLPALGVGVAPRDHALLYGGTGFFVGVFAALGIDAAFLAPVRLHVDAPSTSIVQNLGPDLDVRPERTTFGVHGTF